MRIVFCFFCIAISGAFTASIDLHPLSDEYIDFINSQQSTWTAGRNFDKNTPKSYFRGLLGVRKYPEPIAKKLSVYRHSEDVHIPKYFDAREHWPDCKLIGVIRDQSACGSCWAVAAASSMSDRLCIHSDGTKQVYVSDQELVSCCYAGGYGDGGCSGGYVVMAYYYWNSTGLPSGGPYNSSTGCKAYSMPPCGLICPAEDYASPECKETCDSGSSLDLESDKTYGQLPYYLPDDAKQIQLEILKNGPVEATYEVFDDFWSYKSGIYQRVSEEMQGLHAVKLVGWGVEKDIPYWLVANSWNEDWGENGFFKIIRGQNECNIEQEITTSLPSEKSL